MASKLVFIGGRALKAPLCNSGCIPDAASCRVKSPTFSMSIPETPSGRVKQKIFLNYCDYEKCVSCHIAMFILSTIFLPSNDTEFHEILHKYFPGNLEKYFGNIIACCERKVSGNFHQSVDGIDDRL